MRRALLVVLLVLTALPLAAQSWVRHPGMRLPGNVARDTNGVAHIRAFTDFDVAFLNGWVHAEDRLFQMDENRRTANGTLAELLGASALPQDIQLRTLGLSRAAVLSSLEYPPRVMELLNAYAAGVNAWVASHPLPPEYARLEITNFAPWTALDTISVAKLLSFGLSFDLDIENTVALLTYQGAGAQLGFNGSTLFFEDLFRSQPFYPASTVPDSSAPTTGNATISVNAIDAWKENAAATISPAHAEVARQYLADLKEIPFFDRFLDPEQRGASNEWAIAPRHSATGNTLMANDPHLALRMPATFYPIGLSGVRINAAGMGFPGVPFVVQGNTRHIAWGSTVNPMDVTDAYTETVVPDATAPAGLSAMFNGVKEPLAVIPQAFLVNNPANGTANDVTPVPPSASVPAGTLIVSRRNAPIVSLNLATGAAVSVQWIGHAPTREIETFLLWNEAKNLDDFRNGLQFFDVGSQNFMYNDVDGNIAYFTSGEMPLREDLQANTVTGAPPFILRNGSVSGNDWLRVTTRPAGQASPYQILPASEMPFAINPANGWIVNANNDPIGNTLDNNALNQLRPGGGIFYLSPGYAGFRAGRITELIKEKLARNEKFTVADMQRIQADVVLPDARYFVPFITAALDNGGSSSIPALAGLAAHPGVVAAVNRLRTWDFSAPTGIFEGYDAADVNGVLSSPTTAEMEASIAATLYSVWRGQFIKNTIDAVLNTGPLPRPGSALTVTALKNLLDNYGTRHGAGASGVNFFNVPPMANTAETAAARRDILILKSMADTLGLLASEALAPAFARSTDQNTYHWGKLHRIVFRHPLGGDYNTPPAGGAFPAPLPGLAGIPVDGGFEVVDASTHNSRAATLDGFMFTNGPVRRGVAEGTPGHITAVTSLPGGASGILGNPLYINLLKPWLTNEAFSLNVGPRVILPWGAR